MPILIDGHNLIGALPGLSLEDPDDEETLIRLLVSYRARTGKAITVVFDPGMVFALAETHRRGGVEVIFASHGSSADALILRRVRRSRSPRQWLVVTSDQGLAGKVVRFGGRVRSAEAFVSELNRPRDEPPSAREIPPSPEDVEAWLAMFEGEDG